MTPATITDTSTANGAATVIGMRSASNGTATSASPNPNADRISVATKITTSTWTVIESITCRLPLSSLPGTIKAGTASHTSYRASLGQCLGSREVKKRGVHLVDVIIERLEFNPLPRRSGPAAKAGDEADIF